MSGWVFDLGNTRLKAAPVDAAGRLGPVLAITHRGTDLGAEIERRLPASIGTATVASVAGEPLRVALLDALTRRARRISLATTTSLWDGLRVAYADPSRLGVDRFLAMLGACAAGSGAVLVCGVGTAITIDLVDADGRHRGGRIAPSPDLMREALHDRVPQLAPVGGTYHALADDTDDALASGCQGAAIGLVEQSLASAARLLGETPRLVLHGGGAAALAPRLPAGDLHPDLVLEGLARWIRPASAVVPAPGAA